MPANSPDPPTPSIYDRTYVRSGQGDHLIAEFGDESTALSANINAALRQVKDQRAAQAQFDAYVADLLDAFGEPDAEAVDRFDTLFGARDGAVIMTGDVADLRRLASTSPGVKVAAV